MGRGLAIRKQQRDRIIKKRVKIVKQWYIGLEGIVDEPHQYLKEPGRLFKLNLNCGCKRCHYYKNSGNSKVKYSYRDLKNNEF